MNKKTIKFILTAVILGITAFFISTCKIELPKQIGYRKAKEEEKRAVFFSYAQIEKYFKEKEESKIKASVSEILTFLKEKGFNMILMQVRPFSDAIYESKIYPISRMLVEKEGNPYPIDLLDYFIKEAHKKNIEVHAWINPYRIRNNTDIESISIKSPAYKWIGTRNVAIIEGKGIYYNPASKDVQDLIVQGIEELINNYDIDGIHFDDYFYPNDTIDEEEYKEYQSVMSKKDFHLMQVNTLVKRVYETVKKKKNLVFGISPEGNIENNYVRNYADIKTWLKEEGYIDYIMPQIYYGFENEVKPFERTLEEWNSLIENNVSLLPALALYKSGEIDQYAKSGQNEWKENTDIIKREVEISRKKNKYKGFSIFQFDYLYKDTENKNLIQERENLFKLLEKN